MLQQMLCYSNIQTVASNIKGKLYVKLLWHSMHLSVWDGSMILSILISMICTLDNHVKHLHTSTHKSGVFGLRPSHLKLL